MIQILIVDDEKIERNGIKFLLKQLNIEVRIREAVNGMKAVEELEKEPADILLTDIKMPFMDGLQLIEKVAPRYPEMKIVIFSGYGEFEYARKAMKAGVSSYILKPVDPGEFKNTMENVIKDWESKRLDKEIKEKSQGFVKEHVLMMALNGAKKEQVMDTMGKLVDTSFLEEYKFMMLLEFDRDVFGKKAMDFSEKIQTITVCEFDYLNLNQQQCLLLFNNAEISRKETAHSILQAVANTYGEKGYVAVSGIFGAPVDFAGEFEKLELLMENKFYLLDDNVFMESDEVQEADISQIDDDRLMKQIRQDIKVKDMVGLRQHFEKLCEKYKSKKNFSQVYVKFIFSNLLKNIYEILPEEQNRLNEEVDRLYRTNDFLEVAKILDEGIEKLEESFAVNPQMMHREIETVKEYIYENYDKELSVDMLADQVFMAPSYLSHIFKKETGQNLSKFIKALRMEKAKEMLEESHNKIVNISYAVGYPNVSYFCQSFREYFGVSPQKYRNQGDANADNNEPV